MSVWILCVYCLCVCLHVCLCVLFQGGGLLLCAVIQCILYNNWQCVGGSRHLERCNPILCLTLHTVCVSVHTLFYVFVSALELQIDTASSTVVSFLGART